MRLTVTRAGRDFGEAVSAAEAKAGPRGLIQVFLNLGDATAPPAVEMLRGRGYFLAGLLPYWFGADGLLLQKVRLEPDWDAIHGVDQKATAIRDMPPGSRLFKLNSSWLYQVRGTSWTGRVACPPSARARTSIQDCQTPSA